MTVRGWKARQEAAKAKLADLAAGNHPVASTEIGQQRAALLQARADADRAAAEERERVYRETHATCPCCAGRGHVIVADAAVIVEAVERYKNVGWKPDPLTIGRLLERAFEVDRHGQRVTAEAGETTPTETNAKPIKARKPHVPPPFLED